MFAARLITGLVLALTTASVGDRVLLSDEELLRRAEEAFRQGVVVRTDQEQARPLFARAADLYEQLRRRGADNADLYRNLGRASLLADRLPEAVLAYRRGLRCAPQDRGLHVELEYARDQVHYPSPDRRGRPDDEPWPSWLPRVGGGLFLATGLGLYALAWCCAARALTAARPHLLGWAGLLLTLGLVAGGLWIYLRWRAASVDRYPIVVLTADGVSLRRGNGPTYPEHPTMPQLNRGMEAGLRHRRGGWLQIQLPGGEVGWVPTAAVLVED